MGVIIIKCAQINIVGRTKYACIIYLNTVCLWWRVWPICWRHETQVKFLALRKGFSWDEHWRISILLGMLLWSTWFWNTLKQVIHTVFSIKFIFNMTIPSNFERWLFVQYMVFKWSFLRAFKTESNVVMRNTTKGW